MGVVGRLDQYASMLAYEFDDYSMSENLVTYSNDFSQGVWAGYCGSKSNITYNTTDVVSPDGRNNSTKVARGSNGCDGSLSWGFLWDSSIGGIIIDTTNTFTASIYARGAVGGEVIIIGFNDSQMTNHTLTTSWQRISRTGIANTTDRGFQVKSDNINQTFYILEAQLERGSVATDYTPTIGATISRILPATTNTNITGLGTYYSSGFDENVGFTTFLPANVFAPYDPVYDEFSGTSFGAGQGRYMRQNTDKSVIVYNEIDEITDLDIVKNGLVLNLDAGNTYSYPGSGTTWTDLSGNSTTGTLVNGVGYNSGNGGSLVFDGSNDHVTMSGNNISGLSAGTTDFSICIWVKYNSTASYGAFFAKQNSISSNPGTVRLDLGWFSSTLYLTTSNATTISDGSFLYPNNSSSWYQICLTCGVNSKVVYVNGTQTFSQNFTSFYPNNTYSLYIGGDRELNGNIAQTQIYNRALSAAEVSQNYNALKSRYI